MSEKLGIVKKYLAEKEIFDGSKNKVADLMTQMLNDEIPYLMRYAIANFTMASFVGHFHYKIRLADDNLVPPNVNIFLLAKSGMGKTSSVEKLKLGLKAGYDMINSVREAKNRAKAEEEDEEIKPIAPLDNELSTEAGMIQTLNDFKKEGLGLPAMVIDEVATELATNADMVPNMKLIAKLFDSGDCKVKRLKDREAQSEEVKGMGMNALFIGSDHGILEDDNVLKKFEDEFISKFARRCMFLYPEFEEVIEKIETIDDIVNIIDKKTDHVDEIKDLLNALSKKIATKPLTMDVNLVNLHEDTLYLYKVYLSYCEEMAKIETDEPIILEQQHRHWKALKLSAVYAIFDSSEIIHVKHLKEAINTVEASAPDLKKFLKKAKREVYEVMADHYLEGGDVLTLHDMIKKGWIKKEANLKDLVKNANSMVGKQGMFEIVADKVIYAENDFNDKAGEVLHASYKKLKPLDVKKYLDKGLEADVAIKKAKEDRAKYEIDDGYVYKETTFENIAKLLCNDTAYTPFKFLSKEEGGKWNSKNPTFFNREDGQPNGGIRLKDNIASSADFVVLDIDKGEISVEEAHNILCDFKHHIAKTSDNSNPYKYRIILPSDINIEVTGSKWQALIKKIAEFLGFEVDDLPQSQIFYGFHGREVLSEFDGDVLPVSDILKTVEIKQKKITIVPRSILDKKWEDRLNEFAYAYAGRSRGGSLHLNLYRAMEHAHDLGFTYEENVALLDDIIDHIRMEYNEEPRESYLPSLESQRRSAYGRDDEEERFVYESD